MPVPVGRVQYTCGAPPCSGIGLAWTGADVDDAARDRLAAVLMDRQGRLEINALLAGLVETEFMSDGLRRILSVSDGPEARTSLNMRFQASGEAEEWRVGEALAAVYLEDHRRCRFPWPAIRDLRNMKSSLPGADLVGFTTDDDGRCFAFGEVKTSGEHRYPPRVLHGEDGLILQLSKLRDDRSARDDLVRYLGYRAVSASWNSDFKDAVGRYLKDSTDVAVFGMLIRDVPPDTRDLHSATSKLASGDPSRLRIEFLAIYVPAGSLRIAAVASPRSGGIP